MQKTINYFITTIFIALIFFAFLILKPQYQSSKKVYLLKSYKNTVALYDNGQIIKVYNDVVLNSLPTTDIINFKKGVVFETITDVEIYMEDFDS